MRQKTVLIADDEANILILIEQTLEQLEEEYNVELISVKNGEEALEIIKKKSPISFFSM
jgi:two-component system, OmpR family, alkaline phosphatase synthesis response regulator PhoP